MTFKYFFFSPEKTWRHSYRKIQVRFDLCQSLNSSIFEYFNVFFHIQLRLKFLQHFIDLLFFASSHTVSQFTKFFHIRSLCKNLRLISWLNLYTRDQKSFPKGKTQIQQRMKMKMEKRKKYSIKNIFRCIEKLLIVTLNLATEHFLKYRLPDRIQTVRTWWCHWHPFKLSPIISSI